MRAPLVGEWEQGEVRRWAAGTLAWPDAVVAGETATWTAAVLSSLSGPWGWSTGLDQPIYRSARNGGGLVAWRGVDDLVAECCARVAAGYRRFVWWDVATLREDAGPFGAVVDGVWGSAPVRSLTTSHKLRWFVTTAVRPEAVTLRAAAVLRRARVPHLRLRLDRYRPALGDVRSELAACVEAGVVLRAVGFGSHEIDVMVEAGYPGDSWAAAVGVVLALLGAGLSPRLQGWAPIPGSYGWAALAAEQRVGAGFSKWLPGCASVTGAGLSVAEYKQLHTLVYHGRELLHAGIDAAALSAGGA